MRQVKAFRAASPAGSSSLPVGTSNMRLALAHVDGVVKINLRFGQPLNERRLDRWRSVATFAPGAICCTVRWFAADSGGASWELLVLRAPERGEAAVRVEGVAPGAQVLLHVRDQARVEQVLALLACVEDAGVAPCALPAAYWRRLAGHFQARDAALSSSAQLSPKAALPGRPQ